MAGVSLEYRIDDAELRAAWRQLEILMGDTTPVMRTIGKGLVKDTHGHFETESDPWGNAWAPLNPAYAETKRGAGILRESAMRGGLMGSITYRAGRDSVETGSNKPYAGVHQGGATIEPKNGKYLRFPLGDGYAQVESVTIPARQYLGIGPHEERTILESVIDALDRAVARASGI